MENVVAVKGLVKRYGDVVAVDGISLEVRRGEIFGLLGPNGAGKTTTIRILMEILVPDEGEVRVLGRVPAEAKDRVGYLPEERGLYRNDRVLDVLVYLAALKGMRRDVAADRAMRLLERMELEEWVRRRVRELSRGMQQRLQLLASVVHDPEVLILDEPFQGLDPVNVDRVKRFIAELREQGKTILLSSHQMNLVEVLCDRIALIHRGRVVVYGALDEVKAQFARNTIRLKASEVPVDLPGVVGMEEENGARLLSLAEGVDPQEILRALVERGVEVRAFEVAPAPLDEIFVRVVQEEVA